MAAKEITQSTVEHQMPHLARLIFPRPGIRYEFFADAGANVRGCGHATLASFPRKHAETIRAAARAIVHFQSHAAADLSAGYVRPPDRDHAPGFPLRGGGTAPRKG